MWCWRYTITSELAVSADRLLDVFWSKIYIYLTGAVYLCPLQLQDANDARAIS